MGNTSSDSGEQDAYKVIRWIPGVVEAYSAIRAIVYVAKGNNQQAIDSSIGALGPLGMVINGIRLSDLFDERSEHRKQWKGGKTEFGKIPKGYFNDHLFDSSRFSYLFDNTLSERELALFDISPAANGCSNPIVIMEGEYTNIPAFMDGSRELKYFDAINTSVVLTSYLVAFNNSTRECAMFVVTYKFKSSNIFNWTRLNDTKRQDIEDTLSEFRVSARSFNLRTMKENM